MNRVATAILTLFLFCGTSNLAQTLTAGGDWFVELTLPLGDTWFNMFLAQKGNVLSGHMVNDTGEYEVTGTVNRDQIKLEWSFPDGGHMVPVTFNGKFDRSSMEGMAKVGDVGQGPMSAQRR